VKRQESPRLQAGEYVNGLRSPGDDCSQNLKNTEFLNYLIFIQLLGDFIFLLFPELSEKISNV
jgi:hypothetical protein